MSTKQPPNRARQNRAADLRLASPLVLFCAASAHAGQTASCRPGDTDLVCHMRSVLTLLHVAAILLGLVLVAAVLVALRAYRSKPRKLSRDDIHSDAA